MPTTFTIKQIPDVLANRLRRRAEGNHRSLQRELLLILENAATLRVAEPSMPVYGAASERRRERTPRNSPVRARRDARLSLDEVWQRARKLGATMPSESADLIRRDRDARYNR